MTHRTFQTGALFFASLLLAFASHAQTTATASSATSNGITIAADSGPVSVTVDENGEMTISEPAKNTATTETYGVTDRGLDPAELGEQTSDVELASDSEGSEKAEEPVQAKGPILPHDLSPWGMFMQADWVVKAVMIGLALASIATWTVLVAKSRELQVLVKQQRQTLAVVSDAKSLKLAHEELEKNGYSTELTLATAKELQLSANALSDAEGVKERVASSLERLEAANGRAITKGIGILATIGSTGPFVGLFGTVWGIMNSFIGISKAQTTNLAVVAPGIAEALLATALGLVAAIPAVVIYNHFARQIAAYKALVGDTSAAVLRVVSRDLSHYAIEQETTKEA